MGDSLQSLPTDATPLSETDRQAVDLLFPASDSKFHRLVQEFKKIFVIGVIFIIFSLPYVDNIIGYFSPSVKDSPYILLGVKAILFMIILYCLENFRYMMK